MNSFELWVASSEFMKTILQLKLNIYFTLYFQPGTDHRQLKTDN